MAFLWGFGDSRETRLFNADGDSFVKNILKYIAIRVNLHFDS